MGFDLSAWLRGVDKTTTIRGVIALLDALPHNCAFRAHWNETLKDRFPETEGQVERGLTDEEKFQDRVREAMEWDQTDKLIAQVINAIHQQTLVSNAWKKGQEPDFPLVGPQSWRDQAEDAKKKNTRLRGDGKKETGKGKTASTVAEFYAGLGFSSQSMQQEESTDSE